MKEHIYNMELKDIETIIESSSVANDILYGNSSIDMLNRGIANPQIKSVAYYIKDKPSYIEALIKRFTERFNQEISEYYALGTTVAYLAVFTELPSIELFNRLSKVISEFNKNSIVFELLSFSREKIKKEIDTNKIIK